MTSYRFILARLLSKIQPKILSSLPTTFSIHHTFKINLRHYTPPKTKKDRYVSASAKRERIRHRKRRQNYKYLLILVILSKEVKQIKNGIVKFINWSSSSNNNRFAGINIPKTIESRSRFISGYLGNSAASSSVSISIKRAKTFKQNLKILACVVLKF